MFSRTAQLLRAESARSRATDDALDGLPAPTGRGDAIDAWIAADRRHAALTQRLAAAYASEDETAVATLSEQASTLQDGVSAAARRLGLRRCSAP